MENLYSDQNRSKSHAELIFISSCSVLRTRTTASGPSTATDGLGLYNGRLGVEDQECGKMMAKAEHQGGGDDQSFILYMQPGDPDKYGWKEDL
jgi:hypothetical protein